MVPKRIKFKPIKLGKEEEEIMPLPFHCVECDKPILVMQGGLCDECTSEEEE